MEYLPTEGATKRFPTEHVGEYATTLDPAKTKVVAMARDDADYLVAVDDTAVHVFNSDGTIETVSAAPGAFDYLSGADHSSFRFQQVADTLYVANTDVTVLGAPGRDFAPWVTESDAGVFVRQTEYGATYEVATPLGTASVETQTDSANYASRVFSGSLGNVYAQPYRITAAQASGTEPILIGSTAENGEFYNTVRANEIGDLDVRHLDSAYVSYTFAPANGSTVLVTMTSEPVSGPPPTSNFGTDYSNGGPITAVSVERFDRDLLAVWLTPDPLLQAGEWVCFGNTGARADQSQLSPTFVARQLALQLDGLGVTLEPAYMKEPSFDLVESSSFYMNTGDTVPETPYSATITTGSGSPGTDEDKILLWVDEVEQITKLPVFFKQGAVVRVTGDAASTDDDYFIQFTTDAWREQTEGDEGAFFTYSVDLFGRGVWRETAEPGLPTGGLDSSTMPHRLRRDSAGAWSFQPVGWGTRPSGDNLTNPEPSFVGGRILDIFYHEDRLGFSSDANVIMSESGEIENFWRTSVLSLPGSDPIDVTLAALGGSSVYHVVPFDRKLFAFSEEAQAVIDGSGGPLTPSTVSAKVTGRYRTSPAISPVSQRNSLFAPYTTGGSTQLRELVPGQYEGDLQAVETTLAVPRLLPNTVRKIMPSSGGDDIICLTDEGKLFLYQYLRAGNESYMSAWGRWDFPGGVVVDAAELQDTVYLFINRDSKLRLERVNVGAGRGDLTGAFKPRMDRLATIVGGSYDIVSNTTAFSVPYDFAPGDTMLLVSQGASVEYGAPLTVSGTDPATDTITVPGDWSGETVWVGQEYDCQLVMTRPVVQSSSQDGGRTSVVGGNTHVRDVVITLTDTGYLLATVESVGQNTTTEEFLADRTDVGEITPSVLSSREFQIPIHASSDEFRLTLSNKTPMPCTLVNGAWAIRFNSRYRQA
jgi:hypothetical protein